VAELIELSPVVLARPQTGLRRYVLDPVIESASVPAKSSLQTRSSSTVVLSPGEGLALDAATRMSVLTCALRERHSRACLLIQTEL